MIFHEMEFARKPPCNDR